MPARKRRRQNPAHKKFLDQNRHHYDGLLEFQQGGCAICHRLPSPVRRLDLDHDHKQLTIRGLLCHKCNRSIPAWMSPTWLRDCAEYLEDTPFQRYMKEINER